MRDLVRPSASRASERCAVSAGGMVLFFALAMILWWVSRRDAVPRDLRDASWIGANACVFVAIIAGGLSTAWFSVRRSGLLSRRSRAGTLRGLSTRERCASSIPRAAWFSARRTTRYSRPDRKSGKRERPLRSGSMRKRRSAAARVATRLQPSAVKVVVTREVSGFSGRLSSSGGRRCRRSGCSCAMSSSLLRSARAML